MKTEIKNPMYEGEAELFMEGSWGTRDMGKHKFTMEWFEGTDAGSAEIEWYIESMDMVEHIGLTFEMRRNEHDPRNPIRALIDYDGVMSLNEHAIKFMESLGIVVDQEFKE